MRITLLLGFVYGVACILLYRLGYVTGEQGAWLNCIAGVYFTVSLQWYTGGFHSPMPLGPSIFAVQVCVCVCVVLCVCVRARVCVWLNCIAGIYITVSLQWYTGGFHSPMPLGPSIFAVQVCFCCVCV